MPPRDGSVCVGINMSIVPPAAAWNAAAGGRDTGASEPPGPEDHSVAMVTRYPAVDPRGVECTRRRGKQRRNTFTLEKTVPAAEHRENLWRGF